ncbi:MAG TPA: type III pantothenate kinase, partial [Actinomycetota bacterium]
MLLAADIGNTEIVLGIFRGERLEHTWRLSTQPERTPDELGLALSGFLAQRGISFEREVTGLVVASVVPDVTAAVREMAAT